MSNSEEVKFTLKVVINKVLFAEIDSSFADVLLSSLTLPLGTIERLLINHFADEAPTIGSLNTLYQGLSNLESSHFCTDTGKQILLNARNSLAPPCQKLKLNLDDSEPTKYFTCGIRETDGLEERTFIAGFKEVELVDGNGTLGCVKGPTMFMVTDNLVVTPFSAVSSLKIPLYDVEELKFEIGMEEAEELDYKIKNNEEVGPLAGIFVGVSGMHEINAFLEVADVRGTESGLELDSSSFEVHTDVGFHFFDGVAVASTSMVTNMVTDPSFPTALSLLQHLISLNYSSKEIAQLLSSNPPLSAATSNIAAVVLPNLTVGAPILSLPSLQQHSVTPLNPPPLNLQQHSDSAAGNNPDVAA
ncbi:hypothetical protein BUALT_Bualt15G0040800 [Buddleja alternifolia]|uniref:Uncharacterized protein n=1 Tax=Buddleja alternifolia TaxID=168488 RepID=A0AAV6WN95_9LAMI|nr:hypothetical protein BUALT_Bualt15G0040800 [Buddleja alternifolia]